MVGEGPMHVSGEIAYSGSNFGDSFRKFLQFELIFPYAFSINLGLGGFVSPTYQGLHDLRIVAEFV